MLLMLLLTLNNRMCFCVQRNKELEEWIEAQKRQIKQLEEKVCILVKCYRMTLVTSPYSRGILVTCLSPVTKLIPVFFSFPLSFYFYFCSFLWPSSSGPKAAVSLP